MAVDNDLLYMHRVAEEVAHLPQQLQLKAELTAYNLQHWSASLTGTSLVGKTQVPQEPSSKVCMENKGRNIWFMHCNGSELFIGSSVKTAACT